MRPIKRFHRLLSRLNTLPERIAHLQAAIGRIETRQVAQSSARIGDAEFKVFSQWGEDGIIQYLIRHVPIERRVFVEFGVEDYTESNTRFLAINDAWAGLVLDGSDQHVAFIRNDPIYWANHIKAECAFITKENINDLISRNGLRGDIGLLSVDIDGNDYWVWDAIDVVSPRIVICEYNSHFGPTARVSTPYDPSFVRGEAHHSKIFYGASIAALDELARRKGYSLVAGNSAGNNVFFVRQDVLGGLRPVSPGEVYRQARFREFHDAAGRLTFGDFQERLHGIKNLEVHDFESGTRRRIADVAAIMNP